MDSPAAFSRFTSIKPSLAGLPAHTLSWNGCGQAFWQRPVRISLLAFIPLVRRGWSAAGLEEHCPKRADHPPGHALSGRILLGSDRAGAQPPGDGTQAHALARCGESNGSGQASGEFCCCLLGGMAQRARQGILLIELQGTVILSGAA